MSKITYQNKINLSEKPEIADINKVKDSDMNEIKRVVNENYDEFDDFKNKEVVLRDSDLQGCQEIVIPELNTYSRLIITFTTYATNNTENVGSTSSILEMDLTKNINNICRTGAVIPYRNKSLFTDKNGHFLNELFKIIVEVNLSSNKFICGFDFNGALQVGSGYVVKKIVGVK